MAPRLRRTLTAAAALAVVVCAPASARFSVSVFTRVPAPGYPANAIVGPDGTVYTGTFKSFSSPSDTGPSKVFAYSPQGRLTRTYTVQGQTRGTADAVQVSNLDRSGQTLYLLDQDPPRVVTLDLATGRQSTWATFGSVPACPAPAGQCTDGSAGNPPEPDFSAWGPDGSLYVTDYNQYVIWRVPPTGGRARVWFTDPRLNGIIVGPAGIQLMADGRTLLISTGAGDQGAGITSGKLYTLPIRPDGQPGQLHQLWASGSFEAPDGLAIARSGNIYAALVGPSGNAVDEVSPTGATLARIPPDPAANNAMSVPFDAPGSVAFDGQRVLVANQASIDNNAANWAILAIDVGEPGLPVSLPPAPPRRPVRARYRLRVTPVRADAGSRATFRFRATLTRAGRALPVRRALITFAGHHVRTGPRGGARLRLRLPRHRHRILATLRVGGRVVARAVVRLT